MKEKHLRHSVFSRSHTDIYQLKLSSFQAMSEAAQQASSATSNTAKMIQDNLWGRGNVGTQSNADSNEHMKEWTKFFGELPHHSEKGISLYKLFTPR